MASLTSPDSSLNGSAAVSPPDHRQQSFPQAVGRKPLLTKLSSAAFTKHSISNSNPNNSSNPSPPQLHDPLNNNNNTARRYYHQDDHLNLNGSSSSSSGTGSPSVPSPQLPQAASQEFHESPGLPRIQVDNGTATSSLRKNRRPSTARPSTPGSTPSSPSVTSNGTDDSSNTISTPPSSSDQQKQQRHQHPRKSRKSGSKKQQQDIIPPLTKVHFACYQEHRTFVTSPNALYPVPCMTCLKSDQEMRWRCTFCCLRICGECHQRIQKCKRRSLKGLLEDLVQALEGTQHQQS